MSDDADAIAGMMLVQSVGSVAACTPQTKRTAEPALRWTPRGFGRTVTQPSFARCLGPLSVMEFAHSLCPSRKERQGGRRWMRLQRSGSEVGPPGLEPGTNRL